MSENTEWQAHVCDAHSQKGPTETKSELPGADFARVFRAAPGCQLLLDPKLRIVDVNDAYLREMLMERATILGRALFEIFPTNPDDPRGDAVASLQKSLERVLERRCADRMLVQRSDIRLPEADGGGFEARYWSPVNTPVLDATGEISCIIHCLEDVTKLVRLKDLGSQQDEALAQLKARSEQRFAQLLDAAPDAIVVVSSAGCIEFVNEQSEKLFGYSRAELVGSALEVLIPERMRGRHGQHVGEFFAGPRTRPMGTGIELVARRNDGSEFPIEVSLSPLRSEHGMTVSAAIRDISQRKRIEAEARLHAERFASAVESMHDAFAMFDAQRRLIRCNAAYRELLGPSQAESLVGKTREQLVDAWLAQLDPALSASAASLRDKWLYDGPDGSCTLELRTRQQRSLRVNVRCTSQGDLVESIWDVTEDERRADELRQARAEAEAASAAKNEFLSSMSHELRTPMNAILGFAQLLSRDRSHPLTERHRERVAQILQSGDHLLHLIDDVLDLARIESGRVSISAEAVSVGEVIAEVMSSLEPLARKQQLDLRQKSASPDIPSVLADRVRLIQILTNFGTNAIKYNRPPGQVVFTTERYEHYVRVVVEDSGSGIALDQQPKLFQPFQRAGQETGAVEGTGIGLLITKRLAELMGGQVGFHSLPGVGSRFWVELPLAAALVSDASPKRSTSKPVLDNRQSGLVLYVEDNQANLAFMADLFESLDSYSLVTAKSAEEGLRLARDLKPRIVLMDINLPGMNGVEALAKLRQAPETSAIPVIALTAAASERDRRRGLQDGFFRYLTKPIDIDELLEALDAARQRA